MRYLSAIKFKRTTLLTAGYAGFLVGVYFICGGHIINQSYIWLTAGLLFFVFRKRNIAVLLLVLLITTELGSWRGYVFAKKLNAYEAYYGQTVSLTARAMNDGTYGKNSQLSFDANHVIMDDSKILTGKLQLRGIGMNAVFQGDEVNVEGKLYPGFGSYQGRISFAKLSLAKHNPSLIADIRRRFAAGMQSALPEPLAPFAMGLLIGQRATLPDQNKQELLMVGLTHIIAVSGYNLTIILQASKGVFGKFSKRLATLLALLLIGVFLLLAGASASIVRAAIVSTLSIFAAYYGRSFKPVNLILFAAAITVWANPVYIWSDISWYLSFLAFYGVMVLSPAVSERLAPGRELPLVLAVGLESICAEMMTLPYVLHVFGQMSLIGLPANVLVVSLVPLAMLLGLIAGLAGMFVAPIAGWLAWPAKFLLTYMLDIAHVLSSLPHIFIENIGFSAVQMLAMYVVVLLFANSLRFKIKTKSSIITDKRSQKLLQAITNSKE